MRRGPLSLRGGSIELQYEDGTHFRWIGRRIADQLVESEAAKRLHKRKSGKTIIRLLPYPPPSESKATPGAITAREILANVGIGSNAAMFAVRRKLRGWQSPER